MGTHTYAYAVNDSGTAVGVALTGDDIPFVYDGSTMTALATLGGDDGAANDVNSLGDIVGYSKNTDGQQHATIWSGGGSPTDLGTLGGSYSLASAINDYGVIAGYSTSPSYMHAFVWDDGVMTDLGTLGGTSSYARDINDAGCVVGNASTTSGVAAFIWDGSVMYNLNDFVVDGELWTLTEAKGINDLGQIVGYGQLDGQSRAFLLTPIVPAPASLILGVLGVGLTIVARRRRG
jgi:probable HAF family extracellular repeat protein